MIWWEGRGAWGIIILLGSFIGAIFGSFTLVDRFPRHLPQSLPVIAMPVGLLVGGILCWILGRRWNRDQIPDIGGSLFERICEDFEDDVDHTIYSLAMEYWGAFAIFLGVLIGGLMIVKWIVDLFH